MRAIFIRIFLYSSWLTLGWLEAGLGIERVINSYRKGDAFYTYILAIIQFGTGVVLILWAKKVATVRTKEMLAAARNITIVLFLFVLGFPIFSVAKSSFAMLTDQSEVNPSHIRMVAILGMVEVIYVITVLWSAWRIDRKAGGQGGKGTSNRTEVKENLKVKLRLLKGRNHTPNERIPSSKARYN